MIIQIHEHITKPVSGILHVGAHAFEEHKYYRQHFPDATRVWIDACRSDTKKIPGTDIFYQRVISDHDGRCQFWRASNGQSSSILPPADHRHVYPDIHFEEPITLPCCTLDSLLPVAFKPNLINMDIQGAELLALRGFENRIRHLDYIYTEVNTRELYQGCAMLDEMDTFTGRHGFERVATKLYDHRGWGDALYRRKTIQP